MVIWDYTILNSSCDQLLNGMHVSSLVIVTVFRPCGTLVYEIHYLQCTTAMFTLSYSNLHGHCVLSLPKLQTTKKD